MKPHRLLDGTEVDLSELDKTEQVFLGQLHRMADEDINYFEIYRMALGPGSVALGGRNRVDQKITISPVYLVARDIATRAGIKQQLILAPEHASKRSEIPADGSMISATQAANFIGVSRAAVYKAIEHGKLASRKIGNVTLVLKKSAVEYKAKREAESTRGVAVHSRHS